MALWYHFCMSIYPAIYSQIEVVNLIVATGSMLSEQEEYKEVLLVENFPGNKRKKLRSWGNFQNQLNECCKIHGSKDICHVEHLSSTLIFYAVYLIF